jgi:hypothetical protein
MELQGREQQGQHSEQAKTHAPMIEVAGVVYNRDHVVKVDLQEAPMGIVTIHTTLGVDKYTGDVAKQVAQFFGATPATAGAAAPAAEPGAGKQSRRRVA